ncbi:MAG TPA: radical SAM protein [Terracidiphilus sp.]|nr:radical SAM protein [Terracidiphilus sp.]
MKVALVTCFNADWHFGRLPKPYIPLNLLCLAASLRERGHEVEIVDQTNALNEGKVHDRPEFHGEMADLIGAGNPDVIGFTTMCNSYPQTLTLARHCKKLLPAVKVVLGGPQATAVALPTLLHFPWVDVIVRGEADTTFPDLIDHWAEGKAEESKIAGLSWRDRKGDCHQTESQPLLDLDRLPFPAYDLYPADPKKFSLVPIEAGRGCPFACTFCSTNLFFSRKYRIKAPARLLAEMEYLHDTYGYRDFDLVHDMLTVDREWVRDFSRLLIANNCSFTWGCSARVDCVTSELLEEMAAAGCVGIFFGIETGSQRLQPIVEKKLQTMQVLPTLQHCAELGMKPTASFITGFPDETAGDALATLDMALDVLQLSPETKTQLHLLAPLVGSPLYQKYKNSLSFDGHSSDISLFLLSDDEVEAVKRYPEVFSSFYFFPTPQLDRAFTKALSASIYTCASLLIALRGAGVDLYDLFAGWVDWQTRNSAPSTLKQDYYLYHFRVDFVRYLRQQILQTLDDRAPQVANLVEYYELQYGIERGEVTKQLIFRKFDFDIDHLHRLVRMKDVCWERVERQPWGLLYVILGGNPSSGFMYLEVPITSRSVEQGDELEIRDIQSQLLTQPKLMIHNKTQHKLLLIDHHMTSRTLETLELKAC